MTEPTMPLSGPAAALCRAVYGALGDPGRRQRVLAKGGLPASMEQVLRLLEDGGSGRSAEPRSPEPGDRRARLRGLRDRHPEAARAIRAACADSGHGPGQRQIVIIEVLTHLIIFVHGSMGGSADPFEEWGPPPE